MRLYLMRHGHAVSEAFDPERPLSGIGRAQVRRLSNVLMANEIVFDWVWYSTKLRAQQTAEDIAHALALGVVPEQKEGLKPNDLAEPIADQICSIAAENPGMRLLVVSHIPFLPHLISLLIHSDSPAKIPMFPEAGMAFLKSNADGNLWRLEWTADPDMKGLQRIS